jgi:hypothetical protein
MLRKRMSIVEDVKGKHAKDGMSSLVPDVQREDKHAKKGMSSFVADVHSRG